MSEIDLLKLDLNLLVVLEILLRERSVTRTAALVGRTQSAVSHALNRMRQELDDPILVRVGGEMRVTPRAAQLAAELASVLGALRVVLANKGGFDPGTTSRRFTLAGPTLIASLLPDLVQQVQQEAPGASVELRSAGPRMLNELSEGTSDLAIGPPGLEPADGLRTQRLGLLHWVVFARRNHPAFERWSVEEWARWPHIRVRTGPNTGGPVDGAARAAGVERRIGVVIPYFLMAPPVLAASDMLFTVPWVELAYAATAFDLVAMEPPFPIDPFPFALYWSDHVDRHPALSWFRGHVTRAFERMLERGAPTLPRAKPPTKRGGR